MFYPINAIPVHRLNIVDEHGNYSNETMKKMD
jgi:hypothetical protein